MTITPQDIKLFGSARMVDATDGGGPMSGVALQDGADNNVFSDISSIIDPARGALQVRSVWMAVMTANTDTLRQAHAVLQQRPENAGVDCLLVHSTASSVATLMAALNAAGDAAGPFYGATTLTAPAAVGATELAVGGVRARLIPKAAAEVAVSGLLVDGSLPRRTVLLPTDGPGEMRPALLPLQELRVPVVSGQYTYALTLPGGTVDGSQRVEIVRPDGTSPGPVRKEPGTDAWSGMSLGLVTVALWDQATGALGLLLPSLEFVPAGSEIVVTYVLGGTTTPLDETDLGAPAFDALGRLTVGIDAGGELVAGFFTVPGAGGQWTIYNGLIYSWLAWTVGGDIYASTVAGSVGPGGELYLPSQAGKTVSSFRGLQTSAMHSVSEATATLPANIDPATLVISGTRASGVAFTAVANALGVIDSAVVDGSYIRSTGALALAFSEPVRLSSLAYEGTQLNPGVSFADLWGLNESLFPSDGMVRVLRTGQVGVLRHTATVPPAAYVAGATINLGRTDLADVRLVGADHLGIHAGWTADLAAGTVHVDSIDGWAQPVEIEHAIEHVAMISGVPDEATVRINRPTTRAFPAGSVLSSAVLLGDLLARVSLTFSQATWTDVWSNEREGAATLAQYNDAAYPIVVSNIGTETERWAFIFRTTTTFDLVGETRGRVASGDTASVFAPINPATGAPYLTVHPAGWGAWPIGGVLRVNTVGARGRLWPMRCVSPGATVGGRDQALLGLRGDINT